MFPPLLTSSLVIKRKLNPELNVDPSLTPRSSAHGGLVRNVTGSVKLLRWSVCHSSVFPLRRLLRQAQPKLPPLLFSVDFSFFFFLLFKVFFQVKTNRKTTSTRQFCILFIDLTVFRSSSSFKKFFFYLFLPADQKWGFTHTILSSVDFPPVSSTKNFLSLSQRRHLHQHTVSVSSHRAWPVRLWDKLVLPCKLWFPLPETCRVSQRSAGFLPQFSVLWPSSPYLLLFCFPPLLATVLSVFICLPLYSLNNEWIKKKKII